MDASGSDRFLLLFNGNHRPYLYGAFQFFTANTREVRKERPFVISKFLADGSERVYGTVRLLLDNIINSIGGLSEFLMETEAKLTKSGLSSVAQPGSLLPESDLTNRILDEQEELVENILLTVSVHTRILTEIFPKKLEKFTVAVYDYDDNQVENVKLSDIANLLLHNRYVLVRGEFIVDLLSNKEFLADSHQMGLKFKLEEYIEVVTGCSRRHYDQ